MPLTPELALCLEAARDKKAEELVVLDLRPLKVFTDYFVICHGTSRRHVLTIADGIEEMLSRDLHREPGHVEGRRVAEWVLLDYIEFVVHVFSEDRRAFYGLERLWGDAPRLEISVPEGAPPPRAAGRSRPRRTRSSG